MPIDPLAELTQPQRDRLAFIELRLRFLGEIRRQDLVARFSIQSACSGLSTRQLVPAFLERMFQGEAVYWRVKPKWA